MTGRRCLGALAVVLALCCPAVPADKAVAQSDDADDPVEFTTVPEHVVGVTRKGGDIAVVVVRCDDPDVTVAAEQLGVWSERPGPRQVRWAVEGSDPASRLPELVTYGATPDGFHSLQDARPIRPDRRHLVVVDGVLDDSAVSFRPADVVAKRIWDGDEFTDLEGLRVACRRQAVPPPPEDFEEGLGRFVLFLMVLFVLVVGVIVLVVLVTSRDDPYPANDRGVHRFRG